jgi:hypothetical protein
MNVHSLLAMVAFESIAFTAVTCYTLPTLANQETSNCVFLISDKADPDM